MKRSLFSRWTHRRALSALGLTALLATAIVYATRREDDAPYAPGEAVEGITSVHKRSASEAAWDIRFTDVARERGLVFSHFQGGKRSTQLPEDMGSGAAFADVDGDGDWDLFVADAAGPLTASPGDLARAQGCRLYRNDLGTFTDITGEAGLAGLKGPYMGAAFGDADNDGFPDLAISSYGGLKLFHNKRNGTFDDVTERSGLGQFHGFYTGLSWADFDSDSRLDLYVCGYVDFKLDPKDAGKTSTFGHAMSPFTINPSSYPPIPNLLLHNEGGFRFREMGAEAGVENPSGRSLSAATSDVDGDGKSDIYVANDVSEGALFMNVGDGLFENRGHQSHVADYRGAMGIATGDPDGDGDMDMFVTHWIAEANALYINQLTGSPGGSLDFEDAAERFGLGQVSTDDIAWGTAFFDADADGRLDLVVTNGSTFEDPTDKTKLVPMPMRLFRNMDEKGFIDVAPVSGKDLTVPRVGRGLAVADIDGDLREEIAVVVNGGPLVLLTQKGGTPGNRIAIRVEGKAPSNRSGFGTRLALQAGGKKQIREIGSSPSYLSQHAPEAIFGLGAATAAESLEVRWPSGKTATFANLSAGKSYLLVEGEAAPRVLPDRRAQVLAFWDAYSRARAAFGKGDLDASAAAYGEALKIDPRHEDCLYALANIQLTRNEWQPARNQLEALLAINPRSQRAHGTLGDIYADPRSRPIQDLKAARTHYEAAGDVNHEETGWIVRLGEVALASGDEAVARKRFESVLMTNPRSFPALYLLGFLLYRHGDRARAQKLFDSAFESLGPQAHPGPGEGDVRKAEKALPSRGAFSAHWTFLGGKSVRMEEAYEVLGKDLSRKTVSLRHCTSGGGLVSFLRRSSGSTA